MAVVRIWALESDYDKDTVGKLACKLIESQNETQEHRRKYIS